MWKTTGVVLLVLSTAGTTTLAAAMPASAEPAPPPVVPSEPSQETEVLYNTGENPDKRRGPICRFETRGDRVHISSTANEASGHGWWINGDCDTDQAVVTVQLQQYTGGSWNDVGRVGQETVRSGGGSANRATGRAECNSSTTTSWRSIVDADLVGIVDDPLTRTTEERQIPCRN